MKSLSLLRLLAVGSVTGLALGASLRPTRRDDDEDDDTPLPLVIWHGLGDSFAGQGIKDVGELADAINPGTFVYSVKVADTADQDRTATFFGNVSAQVEQVCADLAAHPILSTAPAIDALGFSQGGQFLRAYVERCNKPPVRSLVTYGSQHNGIVRFRACADTDFLCKGAMAVLHFGTWSDFVQARLVPAQYYRDPEPSEYEKYLEYSAFLADINNERELKNAQYARNMAKLENFVMIMFDDDTTVVPKETSWFEEVNGTESIPLRARRLYREDWIGLREIDFKGGLKFLKLPGEHMRIPEKSLNSTFQDYFGPLKRKRSQQQPAFVSEEL